MGIRAVLTPERHTVSVHLHHQLQFCPGTTPQTDPMVFSFDTSPIIFSSLKLTDFQVASLKILDFNTTRVT